MDVSHIAAAGVTAKSALYGSAPCATSSSGRRRPWRARAIAVLIKPTFGRVAAVAAGAPVVYEVLLDSGHLSAAFAIGVSLTLTSWWRRSRFRT
jgi:hypothetical protein